MKFLAGNRKGLQRSAFGRNKPAYWYLRSISFLRKHLGVGGGEGFWENVPWFPHTGGYYYYWRVLKYISCYSALNSKLLFLSFRESLDSVNGIRKTILALSLFIYWDSFSLLREKFPTLTGIKTSDVLNLWAEFQCQNWFPSSEQEASVENPSSCLNTGNSLPLSPT